VAWHARGNKTVSSSVNAMPAHGFHPPVTSQMNLQPPVSRNQCILCLRAAVLAAGLAVAAPAAHARSFSAECEARLEDSDVRVKSEMTSYVANSSLGIGELTIRNPPAVRGERTLGMTVAHLTASIDFVQNGIHDPQSNEYCMRPRFTIRLSYSPVDVFIAREIPHGTCAYTEVVHHEAKHVAAYEQQLTKAAEFMENAMRAYYTNTVFYGDSTQLLAELRESAQKRWLPLAQKQLEAVEAMQQAIDSPEEYARYRTTCDGEISRILRAAH
jgi:hypothetical protein